MICADQPALRVIRGGSRRTRLSAMAELIAATRITGRCSKLWLDRAAHGARTS